MYTRYGHSRADRGQKTDEGHRPERKQGQFLFVPFALCLPSSRRSLVYRIWEHCNLHSVKSKYGQTDVGRRRRSPRRSHEPGFSGTRGTAFSTALSATGRRLSVQRHPRFGAIERKVRNDTRATRENVHGSALSHRCGSIIERRVVRRDSGRGGRRGGWSCTRDEQQRYGSDSWWER